MGSGSWQKRMLGVLVAASLAGSGVEATRVHAENIWARVEVGNVLAASGDEAAAAGHWGYVSDYFADRGEWNNAAIFAGRLAEYYDRTMQYPLAAFYYEREAEYWTKEGVDWGYPKLLKAAELRASLELYASSDNPLRIKARTVPSGSMLAKFEPEAGLYFGIYSEQDPKVGNLFVKNADEYGKKPAISLFYWTWGMPFPDSYIIRAKEAGSAVQIAFEPTKGLSEVVDGPYLRQFARAAKAAGIPIFLRYASEMNGPWVAWHDKPELYIEKFRLVAKAFREEGADNVAMVWSPGDVPQGNIMSYYPGDDVVDWVGVSLYTSPYTMEAGETFSSLRSSPIEKLDWLYRTYAERKPLMISEGAVSHYDNTRKEAFTDWALLNLQRLLEIAPYRYPRLKAITYFNVNIPHVDQAVITRNNYMLNDKPEVQRAVRSMLASPYVLERVATGARPSGMGTDVGTGAVAGYVPVQDDMRLYVNGKVRFVPHVRLPEVYASKVEVLLDGRVVTEQARAPYSFELDAKHIQPGASLEIRVYALNGQLAVARTYELSPEISVIVDGARQVYEQPPIVAASGRILAPVRGIFESLGATVTFDADTGIVTGQRGTIAVVMKLGEHTAFVNGTAFELNEPPALVNGRTMAPVRFVGEVFGGIVEWDGEAYTVRIRTGR